MGRGPDITITKYGVLELYSSTFQISAPNSIICLLASIHGGAIYSSSARVNVSFRSLIQMVYTFP